MGPGRPTAGVVDDWVAFLREDWCSAVRHDFRAHDALAKMIREGRMRLIQQAWAGRRGGGRAVGSCTKRPWASAAATCRKTRYWRAVLVSGKDRGCCSVSRLRSGGGGVSSGGVR